MPRLCVLSTGSSGKIEKQRYIIRDFKSAATELKEVQGPSELPGSRAHSSVLTLCLCWELGTSAPHEFSEGVLGQRCPYPCSSHVFPLSSPRDCTFKSHLFSPSVCAWPVSPSSQVDFFKEEPTLLVSPLPHVPFTLSHFPCQGHRLVTQPKARFSSLTAGVILTLRVPALGTRGQLSSGSFSSASSLPVLEAGSEVKGWQGLLLLKLRGRSCLASCSWCPRRSLAVAATFRAGPQSAHATFSECPCFFT